MSKTNPDRRPQLSTAEARAVDALLASLAQARTERDTSSTLRLTSHESALPPDHAPKAAKVAQLFSLIGQCPVDNPPADLTRRTLERIADDRRRRWFAEQAQALAAPRVGMSWREIAAVAAILVLGFSLLFPMVGRLREDARRVACAGNLQTAGMAIGRYAADNQDSMPRLPITAGQPWWNVGQQTGKGQPVQSNSAHTYLLVRQGYVSPDALNCPDNPNAGRGLTRDMHDWRNASEVGFSTQNQYGEPIKLSRIPGNNLSLMADKNPLFGGQVRPGAPMHFHRSLSTDTPSNFHRGKGQNILMLQGGVLWSAKPILPSGDNIWLANGVDRYTGVETPASTTDTFLVP